MSDNICPRCKSKINKGSAFCGKCGFSLNKQKTTDELKNNFINLKDDIASKIQNKIENEDILKTNDIKEIITNLDEDSLNKLLDKHGISPNKLKQLNFNKLLNKLDIDILKDYLNEVGIDSKLKTDVKTKRTKIMIEDGNYNKDSHKDKIPLVDGKKVKEEKSQNNKPKIPKEERPSNINICTKCGFENRSQVKFCTNCGNKLI